MRKPLSPLALTLVMLVSQTGIVAAQINPDISVIPRFLIKSDDGQSLPAERVFSKPQLGLDEFEVAIQGYLNPYSRADIFLAKGEDEDEPFEMEEVYASFVRGLPFDLNARIGKYLADFGKVNMQHPHLWQYVTRPISLERFLGEEGLNDLGISISTLLPTGDIYSRLSVDLLRGGPTRTLSPDGTQPHGGAGLADTTGGEEAFAYAGRLMAFFPIGENGDLEVGVSALSGVHDPYRSLRFVYGNVDFKYKWKPDQYRSVTLQGEFLANRRTVAAGSYAGAGLTDEKVTSSGAYLFADYQFGKIYDVGARFDWTQSPYATDDKASAVSLFAGFYPVEESTAFRLHLQRTAFDNPAGESVVHTIALQFIFSLGPHKAHPF